MSRTKRSGFIDSDHPLAMSHDLRDGRSCSKRTESRKSLAKLAPLTPWYKAHTTRVHRRVNKQRLSQYEAAA